VRANSHACKNHFLVQTNRHICSSGAIILCSGRSYENPSLARLLNDRGCFRYKHTFGLSFYAIARTSIGPIHQFIDIRALALPKDEIKSLNRVQRLILSLTEELGRHLAVLAENFLSTWFPLPVNVSVSKVAAHCGLLHRRYTAFRRFRQFFSVCSSPWTPFLYSRC
jgi:hypothetical protein